MKKLGILLICIVMICIKLSLAEEICGIEYCLQDFIDSKLFADRFGRIQYDALSGYHHAATYEEIIRVFPGAIDRYYDRAPEIRQILYRIPSENGAVSNYWSNSKLLYSYWKAIDGIFVVIWEGNNSMSDVGLVAGRTLYFSSLKGLTPLQNDICICQENDLTMLHPNVIKRSSVYLGNSIIDVFMEKLFPEQIYCLAYSEEKGFYLKCYLFWESECTTITDCTFIIEDEIKALMEYVNEVECS